MTPLDFLKAIGTGRTKTPDGVYVVTACNQDATSSAVWHSLHGLITLQSGKAHHTAADVVAAHGRFGPLWTLCLYDHGDGLWSTSADATARPLAELAAMLPISFRVKP